MPLEDLQADVRTVLLRCAGVEVTGRLAATCREWNDVTKDPYVWYALYDSTQQQQKDAGQLKELINRPFGQDAVGWTVKVLQSGDGNVWRTGHIEEYDDMRDRFRVRYSDEQGESEVWERESRTDVGGNPSSMGKTRFFFTEAPDPLYIRLSPRDPNQVSEKYDTQGDFRMELKRNTELVPNRLVARITIHRDEVLHCSFSPNGEFFATASRDGTAAIYTTCEEHARTRPCYTLTCGGGPLPTHCAEGFDVRFKPIILFAGWLPEAGRAPPVCRVVWAPDSDVISVCREKIEGIPSAATSSLLQMPVYGPTGKMKKEPKVVAHLRNSPYDLYAAYFRRTPFNQNSLQVLCGAGVSAQGRSYRQRLCIYAFPDRNAPPHERQTLERVADIHLTLTANYMHCARGDGESDVLVGLTGSTVHLCDQVVVVRLRDARVRPADGERNAGAPVYDIVPRIIDVKAACVSAMFSPCRSVVFVTTRPWVNLERYIAFRQAAERSTVEETLQWTVPDIQTTVEVQMWDGDVQSDNDLEHRLTLNGPHAFTTKDSPFLLWADCPPSRRGTSPPDYVASGGEDGFIYVWHTRHQRLLRAMHGHTEAVNCISWHPHLPLFAACSDDHTTTIWTVNREGESRY